MSAAASFNFSENRNQAIQAILDKKIEAGRAVAARVIERIQADVPTDVIARSSVLAFAPAAVGSGLQLTAGDNVLVPSDYALGQIATRAEIPVTYLRELAAGGDWQRELASHALNEHFGHQDTGRVLLRSVRGQLRGMLSDKYRRIDCRPLVDALAFEAQRVGALPIDGTATETRVAIKLLMPEIVEVFPGEYMVYGGEWSDSDYGNGSNSFRAFGLRVQCLNGMTTENVLKQIHLGGRLHEAIEFSDRTYRLDTAASVSGLRDVVRGVLGEGGRARLTASIRKAHEAKFTSSQLKAATKPFTKEVSKAVVDAFEGLDVINLPAGETAWRASNALSWVAKSVKSDETRLDLERAAGALV